MDNKGKLILTRFLLFIPDETNNCHKNAQHTKKQPSQGLGNIKITGGK